MGADYAVRVLGGHALLGRVPGARHPRLANPRASQDGAGEDRRAGRQLIFSATDMWCPQPLAAGRCTPPCRPGPPSARGTRDRRRPAAAVTAPAAARIQEGVRDVPAARSTRRWTLQWGTGPVVSTPALAATRTSPASAHGFPSAVCVRGAPAAGLASDCRVCGRLSTVAMRLASGCSCSRSADPTADGLYCTPRSGGDLWPWNVSSSAHELAA